MQPPRWLTSQFFDVGQKCNHIVSRGRFDFQNALGIELAGRPLTHDGRGANGHAPNFFHLAAHSEFNVEPMRKSRGVGPNVSELGAAVAGNHQNSLRRTEAGSRGLCTRQTAEDQPQARAKPRMIRASLPPQR